MTFAHIAVMNPEGYQELCSCGKMFGPVRCRKTWEDPETCPECAGIRMTYFSPSNPTRQKAEACIAEMEKKLDAYSKYAPFHLDQAVGADVCTQAISIIKRHFAEELK